MKKITPNDIALKQRALVERIAGIAALLSGNLLSARRRILSDSGTRMRAAMLGLALLIAVLPFVLVSGSSPVRAWISNRAYAAIGTVAGQGAIDGMRLSESRRLGASVRAKALRDPSRLNGLHGRDIALAFPLPALARRDGNISVWQYSAADCVVDVYLTGGPETPDVDRKVVYLETRARGKAVLGAELVAEDSGPAGCLKTVLNGPRELPAVALAAAMR